MRTRIVRLMKITGVQDVMVDLGHESVIVNSMRARRTLPICTTRS